MSATGCFTPLRVGWVERRPNSSTGTSEVMSAFPDRISATRAVGSVTILKTARLMGGAPFQ